MTSQKIRVTKEFTFEAAHALDGYDGKCKDIHGHSYKLSVTVIGTPETSGDRSNCGMVIDFADIKSVVKQDILNFFDHRLILRHDSRFKGIEESNERVRYVDYQPTCENMLLEIVDILKNSFDKEPVLLSVALRETGSSFAEWYKNDND